MTNSVTVCLACRIEGIDGCRSCMCGNNGVLLALRKLQLLVVIGSINHTNGNTSANRAKLARPVPSIHIRTEGRPNQSFQCKEDSTEDMADRKQNNTSIALQGVVSDLKTRNHGSPKQVWRSYL